MNSLILVLGATFGSVLVGYLYRRVVAGTDAGTTARYNRISKHLKFIAFFALNPITTVNAFWRMSALSGRLVLYPVLGLLSVTIGGAAAIGFSALLRIPPKRAASVFTAGSFTNIVSIGGLTAFAFFGHDGYALVPLFNAFVTISYYVIGFPLSHRLSLERGTHIAFSSRFLFEQPFMLMPAASVLVGIMLNMLGAPRPLFMDPVAGFLIPAASIMIGFAIGLTLFVSRVREYRQEIAVVSLIKFVIVPAVMIPLAWAIGLPAFLGPVAFRVLVVLCFMPVAFNALIPPVVYGFDLDLANSAWMITTVALIPLLPVLYLLVRMPT